MDLNDLRAVVTAFSFLLFCGLVVWTWMPRRQRAHDEAARLVFEGEADEPARHRPDTAR